MGSRLLATLVAVAGGVLVLGGCSTAPLPGTALPGDESSTSASPAPEPSVAVAFTPVDPVAFGTLLADAGVDFDSPDGRLHCGILGFGDGRQYFGCAVDGPTYDEPAGTASGCGGGFVAEVDGRPEVRCDDTTFAGQTPDRYPDVRVLEVGSSITTLGVTCFSGDDGIACVSDETGAGFRVSAESYELY